ncbi:DUF4181 domain-containing protein [Virgibacillus ihumii]|uniref:DUF4181 domain-containing protein n=1 Tax=Virgibacillus ihumii TaxID=2686091 RepID=UPI00157CE2DF|nr:DUF4181 domain-containing protein [Virgibacillus ihumii]
MDRYGPGPEFWVKLFGMLGGLVLIIFLFNIIMRKVLHVERKKPFSYNHINETHKKADWTLRIIYIILAIVSIIVFSVNYQLMKYSAAVSLGLTVVFLILEEALRAVMEFKYKKGKNDYLLTINQLVFGLVVMYYTLSSEGFGMFDLW